TLAVLVRHVSRRRALVGAGVAAALAVGTAGIVVVTWRPQSLAEPRYTGLLAAAPQAVGSVEDVYARFEEYRAQLTRLIANRAGLYETTAALQPFVPSTTTVRLLHVSDLHLNPQGFDLV